MDGTAEHVLSEMSQTLKSGVERSLSPVEAGEGDVEEYFLKEGCCGLGMRCPPKAHV